MSQFKIGDRVRMVKGYGMYQGKVGTVKSDEYTTETGGPYILWQMDGAPEPQKGSGWYPSMFEHVFKSGDRVKIVKDPDIDNLGRIGVVERHDGSLEGMWPWKVNFSDESFADFDFFNTDQLEITDEPAVNAHEYDDEQSLDEDFIEGYIITDEDNNVHAAWNTYDEAYVDAARAARETQSSLYVYKLVAAFEVEPVRVTAIKVS